MHLFKFRCCPFLGRDRLLSHTLFDFHLIQAFLEYESQETGCNSHKHGLSGVYSNTLFMLLISFVMYLSFFFRDIRKFKDAKKQFEKVSEEKENALVKNAQVQRNKQHEVEEATNILTATRKCFRHIALDYVLQVSTAVNVTLQNHLLYLVRDLSFRSSYRKLFRSWRFSDKGITLSASNLFL